VVIARATFATLHSGRCADDGLRAVCKSLLARVSRGARRPKAVDCAAVTAGVGAAVFGALWTARENAVSLWVDQNWMFSQPNGKAIDPRAEYKI
jgi:hypothetical protein